MGELREKIKNSREIKDTSLNTYMSALKILKKAIAPKDKSPLNDAKFLHDYDNTMNIINNLKKTTSKKNKLTAILVALNSEDDKKQELIDKYHTVLKSLTDEYHSFIKTQTKTETQRKNWISYDELIEVINQLMIEVKLRKLNNKRVLNDKEFDLLQQLLILRTYLFFPLRNDFADMKVLSENEFNKLSEDVQHSHNYLVVSKKGGKKFYISQYKNSKYLGNKVLEIPSSLSRIINLWLKHNTSGFYLVKKDKEQPMSPNGITKFLNKIFHKYHPGKKISTSLLRHIIISHLTKNEPTIAEKEKKEKETENKFLHSAEMNEMYRKID